MTRYTTLADAIDQAVKPALGEWAGAYDADTLQDIAQHAFTYRVDTDPTTGAELANTAGFEQVATGHDFWRIVEQYSSECSCSNPHCQV